MNPFPLLETSVFNEAVIEDVIANMVGAFQATGEDASMLQQLKQIWRSKLQKKLQVNTNEHVTNIDTMSADITKKDAKEEAVPGQQAAATVTENAAAVTSAAPPGMPWVVKEIEMPHLLRYPLVRRKNVAMGHAIMQLDGGLAPIMEESSEEEELQIEDLELLEPEATLKTSDDESLNSGDDPSGDEADKGDLFESENVIACQYTKVFHKRQKWKFDLCNGVMHINGKDYVVKHMLGEADW